MTQSPAPRRRRADAQRNLDALLEAAKVAFAEYGVDVPAKAITDRAGLGVGTLYRHFPQRSDLVIAVLQRDIDACVAAGPELSAAHDPWTALERWIQRYLELVDTKLGLASALHSSDPALEALRVHLYEHMGPALQELVDRARAAGAIRADVTASDLMHAIPLLCRPVPGQEPGQGRHLVAVFMAGLRA